MTKPARLAPLRWVHARASRACRGDRAVPARDGDGEHRVLRRPLQHAGADQRRAGRAADAASSAASCCSCGATCAPACSARGSRCGSCCCSRSSRCLPGALVYAVSVQFLGRSIESWFDVRVDRALDGGMNLGRSSLDYLLKETTQSRDADRRRARRRAGRRPARRLSRAAEQAGVYEAALFSPSGSVLAVAGLGGGMTPEPLPGDALRRARLQQTYAKVEQTQDAGLMLRVVVPVNSERPARSAARAAGDRAACRGRSRRISKRCRRARATTRRSRSRARR